MAIEAVTFDYWKTLFEDDPAVSARRRERRTTLARSFFAAAGKQIDSQQVEATILAAAGRADRLQHVEQRCLGPAEVASMIAIRLGFTLGEEHAIALADLLSSAVRQHPPTLIDGATALLDRLHGRVKLAIISDTGLSLGADLEGVLASHGLARRFDHFTWSDRTLTTKPMPRQFLYTLGMLGVRPDQAVHVGDLEVRDIAGAKAAGMLAVRILRQGDGRASQADATAATLADVPAALERLGVKP